MEITDKINTIRIRKKDMPILLHSSMPVINDTLKRQRGLFILICKSFKLNQFLLRFSILVVLEFLKK
jgi:hypothetical protein